MNEEKQPEHQAVNVEEPDTEDGEEDFEEDTEDTEATAEPTGPTGQQQAVVLVKHKEESRPAVEEIVLKPSMEQADAWTSVLKILAALGIDEAAFNYNGNLTVRVMDSSRVSMLDAEINMGLGLENLTEKPKVKRKFTVSLPQLARALKMYRPTFQFGQCEVVCTTEDNRTKITIPVLEDGGEEMPLPKVTLDIDTNVDFEEIFENITKYLGSKGTPDGLTLISEGGKLTVNGTTDLQKFEMTNFKASKDGKASFSTVLLKALTTKHWAISFANDMPLKAATTITKTDYNKDKQITTKVASISVFLAPRIETDS